MSTPLLPLTHPDIQRHITLGHAFGNRALVIEHAAQFAVDEEREKLMRLAQVQTETAQAFFTLAHRNADYSEPDVRLSNETWRAFEAERGRAAKEQPIYPGKGAHWAAKRAAKAA